MEEDNSTANRCYDVIIVGAGLSGLAAAYHLKERSPSLSFLVLEANTRVGGRTLTIQIKNPQGEDDALDMGAHWVSTRQPHVMELIKKFGIGYYPQNTTGTKIMQVGDDTVRTYQSEIPSLGSWLALIDMQLLINEVEKLSKQVDINNPYSHKLAQELDSMTIETFIRERTRYGALWDIFNSAMNATLGCDSTQVSALFFLAYANAAGGVMNLLVANDAGAQEYRVKGGTQQISHNLLKEIGQANVLFDHAVDSVIQTKTQTQIICRNGSKFACHRLIMTAPPNMIARVYFDPPLPKQQQSLFESMQMGNLTKVFVMYDKSFWLENGYSGEVVTAGGPSFRMDCERGPIAIVYDATTYKGTPVLVCFVAGKNADQWLDKPEADLKAGILDQLGSYFGSQARSPTQFYIKDWRDEPFIGGGPANIAGPGRMQNFFLLRQPHIKIHFAGTAMASQWCGYMTGAIESGYRAASEVLTALDPTSLTSEDRELLAKVHTKKGFPFEKSNWKSPYRRGMINGSLLIGLAAGIIFAVNRGLFAKHITRLGECLPLK